MKFITDDQYNNLVESEREAYSYQFRITWEAYRNGQWQSESETVWFQDYLIFDYKRMWPKHFRKGKFPFRNLESVWVNKPEDTKAKPYGSLQLLALAAAIAPPGTMHYMQDYRPENPSPKGPLLRK